MALPSLHENSLTFHETVPDVDTTLQLACPSPFMENPCPHSKAHFEPKSVKQGILRDCPSTLGVNALQCLAVKN